MKTPILIAGSILLLGLFTSCEYQELHYNPDGSRPTVSTNDILNQTKDNTPKETINISLIDLEKAFDDNQIEADGKYHNKRIKFTAPIGSIDKSLLGEPQLLLIGNNEFIKTTCVLNKSELQKAGSLKKGQKVTVIGENPKKPFGLYLDHCEIID